MPRKKTAKTPHLVLATEEAAIGALNRHVELALSLKAEDAAHAEQIAALNTVHTEQTQALREELARIETSLQLFCDTHRDTFFPADKKSREFPNATIGFYLHPHAVGTIIAKESQETVAMRLDGLEWGDPYVAHKITLNKEALLRDRLKLTPEQLAAAGIKFTQGETFFIEPTPEAADRVTKTQAVA
jgi:phage host-nuclease inhibitor protein Gam